MDHPSHLGSGISAWPGIENCAVSLNRHVKAEVQVEIKRNINEVRNSISTFSLTFLLTG